VDLTEREESLREIVFKQILYHNRREYFYHNKNYKMKKEMKGIWLLLVNASIVIGIQGCGGAKTNHSKDLVVVEQSDSVSRDRGEYIDYSAKFTVDVPVDGPQALVDSIMVFINRKIYNACEECVNYDEGVESFSLEKVFTNEGEHLLNHYMEKYKELIQDSLWKTYFCLTLKLEAQTESYITYSMENYHCGGSCGSEMFYYTFEKRDGHQIKDIITHDNLVRFFEDHPEYATIEDVIDDYDWEFSPEYVFLDLDCGLLDDCFSLVITGMGNHYFTTEISYSKILPYLSPEVQELLKQREKSVEEIVPNLSN
jgi:hypothetical protein